MEMQRWSNTDDPDLRCDFIINTGGQCANRIVDGCTRCPMHGANKQKEAIENKSLRLYRLAKFQNRAEELTDHSKVKSLREEIAILRILLEEKINRCADEHDLLLQSGPISDLVMKIEKIVASCHRLESSLGGLLDKTKIKQIANEMMNSVASRLGEHLEDELSEDKLRDVTQLILEAVAEDVLASMERKNDA
jgi:hypothetical protein